METIIDQLVELKFGRPAWVQWGIDKCIADLRMMENATGAQLYFDPNIIEKVWEKPTIARDFNGRAFNILQDEKGWNVIEKMECLICVHEWTACFEDGTNKLECPNCHYSNNITLEH